MAAADRCVLSAYRPGEVKGHRTAHGHRLPLSEGADEKLVEAKLKLSALKPLWQLYTTVIKEFGEGLGWAVAVRAQAMASPRGRGP